MYFCPIIFKGMYNLGSLFVKMIGKEAYDEFHLILRMKNRRMHKFAFQIEISK